MLEMKYTNWLPNHGFKSNQTCMLAEMKGYKWQQESCSSKKLYVCQTGLNTYRLAVIIIISSRNVSMIRYQVIKARHNYLFSLHSL